MQLCPWLSSQNRHFAVSLATSSPSQKRLSSHVIACYYRKTICWSRAASWLCCAPNCDQFRLITSAVVLECCLASGMRWVQNQMESLFFLLISSLMYWRRHPIYFLMSCIMKGRSSLVQLTVYRCTQGLSHRYSLWLYHVKPFGSTNINFSYDLVFVKSFDKQCETKK